MDGTRLARLRKTLEKLWSGKNNTRPSQLERFATAAGWAFVKRGKHPTWEKGHRTLTIPHHGGSGGAMSPYTVEAILEVFEADLGEEDEEPGGGMEG